MILVAIHQSQQQLVPNRALYSRLKKCIESLKLREFPPFTIFVVFLLYLIEDLGISFLANKSSDVLNQFNNYVILNLADGRILEKLEGNNSIRMKKVTLQKIHKLSNSNWEELRSISFDTEEQKELVSFFETYLSLHLDKEIKFSSFTLLNI
jgi:recombinational DNA repair protein (RecF pathway)